MPSGFSLSNRLLLSTALTLLVFLGLVYYALEQAFVSSVTRSEAEKLDSTILLLLAEVEDEQRELRMPDTLQETKFNQFDSGLYGFVFDDQGQEVWRSYSAVAVMDLPATQDFRRTNIGGSQFGPVELQQEGFLYSTLGVSWEFHPKENRAEKGGQDVFSKHYTFSVLQSADFFYAELERFRTGLQVRLFSVGIVLLFVQLLVLRMGLLPLKRLSEDVSRVEQGDIDQLDGVYPAELQGLTDNLNQLLSHELAQREQHKNRLSDLAHSLKTPLSIARGALVEGEQDRDLLAQQLQQMDEIVQYQLQRASRARPAISQRSTPVAAVLSRLSEALKKVYSDKQVQVELSLEDDATCKMDESDLMELLGNILDNAFKYCRAKVHVELRAKDQRCTVIIEDDGPGIPAEQREDIFARGERLDTQKPGQGIGLAVVNDIVRSYDASISLGDSNLGGASFQIRLP
ncbi:MAG: ATP-binding protein [Pseudomonadales bacterium]